VAVGFSGGLDSTVLLHWLAHSPALRAGGLRAIHVCHGLHADADEWAERCAGTCTALGVELQRVRIDVDRASGRGLEAAAREARHAAFAEELRDGEVLALAHHQDDQAETFLLRALRASGPDGLAAMRPWRAFGRGWLWRPLLDMPRTALFDYARSHDLDWIEDDSNLDTALDRNFLRQRVLPALRERWPHAAASFVRCASLQAEAVDLLGAEDARALARARTADPQVLAVEALQALPASRRARVLRHWIVGIGLPPLPAQGLARIEAELLTTREDAEPVFAWSGAVIRCWRGWLHAEGGRAALPLGWQALWDAGTPLPLPGGGDLRMEMSGSREAAAVPTVSVPPSFLVHARRGGERIVLPGREHSHTLKHVLQQLRVPPWERDRLPLLSDAEGQLLAAGDLAYSASFDAWLRAHGARLVWTRG
jgi:tRNA(Ile)-lysidine synthase